MRRFSAPVSRPSTAASCAVRLIAARTALRVADDVVAGDAGGAAVGREQRGEDADRRRLPGAVRAEQREHLAALDLQVEPVEHAGVAERLREALRLDCVCHTQECTPYTSAMARGLNVDWSSPPRSRSRTRTGLAAVSMARGGEALRLHDDVALPARGEQGRARAGGCSTSCSARRRRSRRPDWRAGLERWARAMRAVLLRHPWGIDVPITGMLGDLRAALVAQPRPRGAGRDRAARRASEADLVLLLNGYVFWAVRLEISLAAAPPRAARPARRSTSRRCRSCAARSSRARSRTTYTDDENFRSASTACSTASGC